MRIALLVVLSLTGVAHAGLLETFFGEAASAVSAPADAPHRVVVEPVAHKTAPSGRWQAIAKVVSMTHRGSIPQWTHQCYPTAKQASDAAVAACERYNHTTCVGEPYIADRCDR